MEVRRADVPPFYSFFLNQQTLAISQVDSSWDGGASVSECLMSLPSFQKLDIEVGAALVCA